jgi:hypothetical protein
MINVFKADGPWKTKYGQGYDVRSVERSRVSEFIAKGYVLSLDEAFAIDMPTDLPDGGQEERDIRNKIKALGGKAGGRSSMETLKAQLEKLEAEHYVDNNEG